jgi:hypothetical protein
MRDTLALIKLLNLVMATSYIATCLTKLALNRLFTTSMIFNIYEITFKP